jgi:Ala-tRNA(Pro) deacylase
MDRFEQLVAMLEAGGAAFRVIEHAAEGQSERVAAVRGTRPSQGAKAILCRIAVADREHFVLAVVPGNRRVDTKAVAALFGGKKASFVPPDIAQEITGCRIGAIPPVAFDDRLSLVADEAFLEDEPEIAFNAGRLDRSIVLKAADYTRIFAPRLARIAVA